MKRTNFFANFLISLVGLMALIGCQTTEPLDSAANAPAAAPISVIDIPPDAEWVVLSGVDEHGLVAEAQVQLMAEPEPDGGIVASIPTGVPVVVENRVSNGPQNLRQFYKVIAQNGMSGWISDYYVRRQIYLFDISQQTVQLFDAPNGQPSADLVNIHPAEVLDATRLDWWQVQTADGQHIGWIPADQVKESPEPEFLFIQDPNHVHDNTHDH